MPLEKSSARSSITNQPPSTNSTPVRRSRQIRRSRQRPSGEGEREQADHRKRHGPAALVAKTKAEDPQRAQRQLAKGHAAALSRTVTPGSRWRRSRQARRSCRRRGRGRGSPAGRKIGDRRDAAPDRPPGRADRRPARRCGRSRYSRNRAPARCCCSSCRRTVAARLAWRQRRATTTATRSTSTTPASASCAIRRRGHRRADEVAERDSGYADQRRERLRVEREADENGASASSVRCAPRLDRVQAGAAGGEHQQEQQRVERVVARDGDERREHRQRERASRRRDLAEAAARR